MGRNRTGELQITQIRSVPRSSPLSYSDRCITKDPSGPRGFSIHLSSPPQATLWHAVSRPCMAYDDEHFSGKRRLRNRGTGFRKEHVATCPTNFKRSCKQATQPLPTKEAAKLGSRERGRKVYSFRAPLRWRGPCEFSLHLVTNPVEEGDW